MLEDQQNQVPPSGGEPIPQQEPPRPPVETPTQSEPESQPAQQSIDPNLSLITSGEPGPQGNAIPEKKSPLIPILIGAVVLLAIAFFLILTLTSKKDTPNKPPVSVATQSVSSQEETQLITTESAATEDATVSETHLAATEETAEPTMEILTETITTEIAPPEQTTPPAASTPRVKRTVSPN